MMRKSTDFSDTLARSWGWSAVLRGAFTALSLVIVLRYLGAAIAVSTGNHVLEGGFAFWSILSQIIAIGIGSVITGYLLPSNRSFEGMLSGAFTWMLCTVIITTLLRGIAPQTAASHAWATFIGSVLSIVTALVGGALGTQFRPKSEITRPAP